MYYLNTYYFHLLLLFTKPGINLHVSLLPTNYITTYFCSSFGNSPKWILNECFGIIYIKEVKAQNIWKLEERVAEHEDNIYFGSSILMSKDQNFINDLLSIGDYVCGSYHAEVTG